MDMNHLEKFRRQKLRKLQASPCRAQASAEERPHWADESLRAGVHELRQTSHVNAAGGYEPRILPLGQR
jgi:hypothetical protein